MSHTPPTLLDSPSDDVAALTWMSAALEHGDPCAVVAGDGCVLEANDAWHRFVQGSSPSSLFPSCAQACEGAVDVRSTAAGVLGEVLRGRAAAEVEYCCTSSLDERRFVLRITGLDGGGGRRALLTHHDMSARRARDELLADAATLHAPTGLPTRSSIEHHLATAAALVTVGPRPALLEVHLRAVPEILALHGRSVAEDATVLAAARLRRVVRADDVVGADDGAATLLVLCPAAEPELLDGLVQRVHRTLDRPVRVGMRHLELRPEVLVVPDSPQETAPGPTRHALGDSSVATPDVLPILEHTGDVSMRFDGAGTILWVSPSAREVLDVDPDSLVGRLGTDLIHPDDRDEATAAFMSIPALGDQVRTEFRVIAGDGSVRWIEEVATNLLDQPEVAAVHASLRDVTERRAAQSSIEFQARLLDSVGQALIAIDDDRRVSYWNDAAARMYGYATSEALGRNVDDVVQPADGWQDRYAELVSHVDHGRAWTGEVHIRHADGHAVPAMVTMSPVFDDRGQQIASVAVGTDMTEQLRSNELAARLASVVASSHDAIISTTLDGRITTWNPAATELFGLSAERMIGRPASELAPPEMQDQIDRLQALVSEGHGVRDVEAQIPGAHGRMLSVSLSVAPIRDHTDTPIGASIVARDLSERTELQRRLSEDHVRLREAQQITHLGSYEYDPSTGVTTRSEECDRIYGLPADEDVNLLDFVHPDDVEETVWSTGLALQGDGPVERTIRIIRRDGTTRWIRCRSALVDRDGRRLLAGTVLDVTDQHLAELALAQQATHDPLTGLPNRTGLHAHLTRLLTTGAPTRVAVAILDLDRFKLINDTLGHRVGDETLRAVADRLRAELDPDDVIARLGGDEFVLVRGDVPDDLCHARSLATDALAALEAPIVVGDRRFDLSGSIGVTLSAPVDSAESLLSDADAAMYLAKQRGGRNVSVFDEAARQRANRHTEVESALRGAVERNEMAMHYQPVLGVADGRVQGFEALARWHHPVLGDVGPDEFVPVAEASGAIVSLGRWAVRTALEQLAAWRRGAPHVDDLWVAINLSAAQLGVAGFVDWFDQQLRECDVPADQVHLEITERVLIDHIEQAVDTIAALRDLGVQISIDDFGTGYSSLSYLDQLPVDVLKVDRSFVSRLGPTARDTAVVRSIVALARTLELQVVVEGVETAEQRAIVAELGCELGQGYLWSPPLAPDAALEYLHAHR